MYITRHLPRRFVLFAILVWVDLCYGSKQDREFLDACRSGDLNTVKTKLETLKGRTLQELGTGCLLVALDRPNVVTTVIKAGVDPSPTTIYKGAQVTPLSWHVYSGHVSSAKALLENGANPNVGIKSSEKAGGRTVAVLDVALGFMYADMNGEGEPGQDFEPYYEIRDLLVEHGAKRYREIRAAQEL